MSRSVAVRHSKRTESIERNSNVNRSENCIDYLSLTTSFPLPQQHRATHASGGGAPCLTAGDTRAERGGTRGEVDSRQFSLPTLEASH